MKHFCAAALAALFFRLLTSCTHTPEPPAPYGQVPTGAQLEWQAMEYYMFCHFGPNTFTGVEWGNGGENPQVFNPSALDCRQWAATAKAAGMKGIIITAKHHDGFCLWPSSFSTHTVRESAWKAGKGDVLRELSDACREAGLKFGVYVSPWDRNHPAYGTPEYNSVFAGMLKEVLGNYGTVFEQWFDGANGEGPGGKRQVYDWELFNRTVLELQPSAIIFSDIGPGCRWVGNERGIAGETNWSTLNVAGFAPGTGAPSTEILNSGNINGEKWVPAEVDVSIRPGWFYTPETDNSVKTVDELFEIYCSSVGRNGNLLLNVPPDRRGMIHPNDSARLMELRRAIDESFAVNLAQGAKVNASHVRGKSAVYGAANLLDGNSDTYWTVDDSCTSASVELRLPAESRFNCIVLQEHIALGQRVSKFSVECFENGAWRPVSRQTTIGYKRIVRFPAVVSDRLRITVEESLACPVLSEVGVYNTRQVIR